MQNGLASHHDISPWGSVVLMPASSYFLILLRYLKCCYWNIPWRDYGRVDNKNHHFGGTVKLTHPAIVFPSKSSSGDMNYTESFTFMCINLTKISHEEILRWKAQCYKVQYSWILIIHDTSSVNVARVLTVDSLCVCQLCDLSKVVIKSSDKRQIIGPAESLDSLNTVPEVPVSNMYW